MYIDTRPTNLASKCVCVCVCVNNARALTTKCGPYMSILPTSLFTNEVKAPRYYWTPLKSRMILIKGTIIIVYFWSFSSKQYNKSYKH